MNTPTVRFCDCANRITMDPLRKGQYMPTLRLSDAETGEPVATITTHREDFMEHVGFYDVLVKDYSENEGLAAALAQSGAFEQKRRFEGGVVLMTVRDPELCEGIKSARANGVVNGVEVVNRYALDPDLGKSEGQTL